MKIFVHVLITYAFWLGIYLGVEFLVKSYLVDYARVFQSECTNLVSH